MIIIFFPPETLWLYLSCFFSESRLNTLGRQKMHLLNIPSSKSGLKKLSKCGARQQSVIPHFGSLQDDCIRVLTQCTQICQGLCFVYSSHACRRLVSVPFFSRVKAMRSFVHESSGESVPSCVFCMLIPCAYTAFTLWWRSLEVSLNFRSSTLVSIIYVGQKWSISEDSCCV